MFFLGGGVKRQGRGSDEEGAKGDLVDVEGAERAEDDHPPVVGAWLDLPVPKLHVGGSDDRGGQLSSRRLYSLKK